MLISLHSLQASGTFSPSLNTPLYVLLYSYRCIFLFSFACFFLTTSPQCGVRHSRLVIRNFKNIFKLICLVQHVSRLSIRLSFQPSIRLSVSITLVVTSRGIYHMQYPKDLRMQQVLCIDHAVHITQVIINIYFVHQVTLNYSPIEHQVV
jgi:hypothetical protein